jgi:(5-formylfuran-3-yl)methyl phosphate synthase
MKLLVSVRDVAEALAVAEAGVGFIDLKEPGAGALGGLPLERLAQILAALRGRDAWRDGGRDGVHEGGRGGAVPVSATIGDWPMAPALPVLQRVAAVAACGVDIVKVGIAPEPGAADLIEALGTWAAQAAQVRRTLVPALVPVFIADGPLDPALVTLALRQPFPALMADTQDKRGGSLLQRRSARELRQFIAQVRGAAPLAGRIHPREVGLAGALRLDDLPALAALAPDFAGFRSAVCEGDRAGALSPQRLATLMGAVASLNP